MLRERGHLIVETVHLRADGTRFPVEVSSRRLEPGSEAAVVAIVRDISAARQAEESFHRLFDNNPFPTWIFDVETLRFLEVNAAAIASYGYSRSEFLAMTIGEIRPPEELAALGQRIEAMRAQPGRRAGGQWRHRRKDGSILEVEISSYSHILDGRSARVVVVHDVTARGRVERDLRKLTRAVEQSSASVVITDLDGNIEYVNPKFSRAHRLPARGGARPEPAHPQVGGDARRDVSRDVDDPRRGRRLAGRALQPAQGRLAVLGGGVDFAAGRLRRPGDPLCRGQGGRHRTPAAGGRARTGAAARGDRPPGGSRPRHQQHPGSDRGHDRPGARRAARRRRRRRADLLEVRAAVERGAGLTAKLLAFGRRRPAEPRAIDLGSLVRGVASMLGRLLGEQIELVLDLPERSARCAPTRPASNRSLINLAVNARDAMPDGGRLTIALAERRIEAGASGALRDLALGDFVELTVADTGLGIPAAIRDHLFEPFVTTKEMGRGTGLGLAVVHGVVTQAHGAIRVESEPGRGSTFRILLPRSPEPAVRAQVEAPPRPVAGDGETVLVAEDDPVPCARCSSASCAAGAIGSSPRRAARRRCARWRRSRVRSRSWSPTSACPG